MLIARPAPKPTAIELAALDVMRGALKSTSQRPHVDQVLKADQTIGTTTTSGWASQIAPTQLGEFLGSLAPLSAAAKIINLGLSVPLPPGVASITIPARTGNPAASTSYVGEGAPVPVRSYTFNSDTVLSPKKFGFIIAVSRELVKRASGEIVIRRLLQEDAAAALDASYFGSTAASSSDHAGLLNGVTPILGFPGADRDAMRTDLVALSDAVSDGGSGTVVYIVSPKRAARAALMWPELQAAFLPSLAIAETTVVALDPLSLVHGTGEEVDIVASKEFTVHMSDVPLEIVSGTGPTTADPVRSAWQTDTIGFRLLSDIAFDTRRCGAAAVVTGATW